MNAIPDEPPTAHSCTDTSTFASKIQGPGSASEYVRADSSVDPTKPERVADMTCRKRSTAEDLRATWRSSTNPIALFTRRPKTFCDARRAARLRTVKENRFYNVAVVEGDFHGRRQGPIDGTSYRHDSTKRDNQRPVAPFASLLDSRVNTLLFRYFLDLVTVTGFWLALRKAQGAIIGSVPYWSTLCEPTWAPNDLNLAAPHLTAIRLRDFLEDNGWTGTVIPPTQRFAVPAASVGHLIHMRLLDGDRTRRFTHTTTGLTITVTETSVSIVATALCSRHILQTAILTPTTLILPHARHFIHGIPLFKSGGDHPPDEAVESRTRLLAMGMQPLEDNSGMSEPCGKYCVGLTRRLRGGRGIGLFRWSLRPDKDDEVIDAVAAEAWSGFLDMRNSVGWIYARCNNTHCDTYNFPLHPQR
ncbi:hypothetical protein C8J57DRAFT_1467042 [Mycena rebaudengoi]|nr:hypothetical protein C8J57DRAFT_1467042 [Mycena rebaudengoi]